MSSSLQLTLTPHELFALPADTPATGAAIRVEVTPKNRPSFFALARLVKDRPYKSNRERDHYRVFFRDEQRPHDDIFCFGAGIVVPKDSLSSEEMRQGAIGKPSLTPTTRFWKPADLPYCIALHSNGSGQIIERPGKYVSNDTFNWCGYEEKERARLLEWNTQVFHSFCRQLVLDPDSEFNFFLNWLTLSPNERTAFATKCENGGWEQLVRLVNQSLLLILHHFVSQPRENGLDVNFRWKTLSYSHKRQIGQWEWMTNFHSNDEYPAYSYACRLQEAIFKIVRPAFWPPAQPLCCYQWLHGYDWFDGENFLPGVGKVEHTVRCKMPTMHEFMEAQLELRDFFRPYLSAAEIEALLKP